MLTNNIINLLKQKNCPNVILYNNYIDIIYDVFNKILHHCLHLTRTVCCRPAQQQLPLALNLAGLDGRDDRLRLFLRPLARGVVVEDVDVSFVVLNLQNTGKGRRRLGPGRSSATRSSLSLHLITFFFRSVASSTVFLNLDIFFRIPKFYLTIFKLVFLLFRTVSSLWISVIDFSERI